MPARIGRVMVGLTIAMSVAMLSSTMLTNALPHVVADLGGDETGLTWVLLGLLVAITISGPIWGRLADAHSKKRLLLAALAVFIAGSVVAGLADSMEMLIGARIVQGVGVGGMTALTQTIIASIVPARSRGRYLGWLTATFAISTALGPLIGGLLVDSALGWRGCFFVCLPLAAAAAMVVQRWLIVSRPDEDPRPVDYAGASLIAVGMSLVLVWISVAGHEIPWDDPLSVTLIIVGTAILVGACAHERRAAHPLVPLDLLRQPNVRWGCIALAATGVALFGAPLFLSQYLQLGLGLRPTTAGLVSLGFVGGMVAANFVTAEVVSRTGTWKGVVLVGAVLGTSGAALGHFLSAESSIAFVVALEFLLGIGVGTVNQNVILVIQDTASARDVGTATAISTFARAVGGCVGVSVLGAVAARLIRDDLLSVAGVSGDTVPDRDSLGESARVAVGVAYAHGTSAVFGGFLILALLTVVALGRMRHTTFHHQVVSTPDDDVRSPTPFPAAEILPRKDVNDEPANTP